MNQNKKLPESISGKIDTIENESGEYYRKGDLAKCTETSLKAWALIPEPKEVWDYYPQSLSSGFVHLYLEQKDKSKVKEWIEIMAKMYHDPNHEDHLVLMTEGDAMYRLGDADRAYYVFGRIMEVYGRDGFAGEQLEYLKFYLAEKAKRGD